MNISHFNLDKQLDRVHEWIKSADQKVSIAFAVENGVIIALSVPVIRLISNNVTLITNPFVFILLVEAIALFIIAEIYAISALIPQIKPRNIGSNVYFGSISGKTFEEYKKEIGSTSKSEHTNDMLNQIVVSAEIASKKHNFLRASLMFFSVAVFMSLLFFLSFLISSILPI